MQHSPRTDPRDSPLAWHTLFNFLTTGPTLSRIFLRLVSGERFSSTLSSNILLFLARFNHLDLFWLGVNWFGIFFFVLDFGERVRSFGRLSVAGGVGRSSTSSSFKVFSGSRKLKISWEPTDDWFSIAKTCDFSLINSGVSAPKLWGKSKAFEFSHNTTDSKYRLLINGQSFNDLNQRIPRKRPKAVATCTLSLRSPLLP